MKQKLFLSLFMLLTATMMWADVEINKKTFPDKTFRKWVLAQPYGKDGVLTDEEIAGVKIIDVSPKLKDFDSSPKIKSLKGIEYFTALERLVCIGTQLTALDVSQNTALKELNCACNQLTALNVSGCTALKELRCALNKLTTLDVSKNTALTELDCIDNKLKTLDVSKNTALKKLDCSYNALTKLNVSNMPELTKLICCHNYLAELNVSNNTALKQLSCFQNKIKGAAMDALVESLPTKSNGDISHLLVIYDVVEQNVMTETQVAAAKAKGWKSYHNFINPVNYRVWGDYDGKKQKNTSK